MLPQLYIVNGKPTSGKDTFVNFCLDKLDAYGDVLSSVEPIKEMAKQYGWNSEKDVFSRNSLAQIKEILDDWLNATFVITRDRLFGLNNFAESYNLPSEKFVLFIFVREPHNIEQIVNKLNAKTILVQRDVICDITNDADGCTENWNYDYIIDNNGTIDELKLLADRFVKEVCKHE